MSYDWSQFKRPGGSNLKSLKEQRHEDLSNHRASLLHFLDLEMTKASSSAGTDTGIVNPMSTDKKNHSMESRSSGRRNRVHFACTYILTYLKVQNVIDGNNVAIGRFHAKMYVESTIQTNNQCIARRIPEQCKVFKQEETPCDLSSHIANLEHSLEQGLGSVTESLKYLMNEVHSMKRSSPPFSNSSSSQDNNHTTSPFPCPNAGTEFDASSDEDGLNLNVNNISSDLNSGALAKAMVDLPGQHVPVSIPPIFPFEVQDILNLDMFSPVLQESLNSIIYPKDVTTKLIDLFFQTLNLQRHPVPKDIIDEAIEDLYKDDTLVTERTLSRFSLLAAVLAISTVFMFVGNAEIRDAMNLDEQYIDLNASRRLYNAAKLACHTLQALGREDVFSVLTYLVLARYTFVTGSPRRSYIHVVHLVRVSYTLGLHRDGSVFGLDDKECERRRMIWALVYSASQTYCLGFGRPPLIMDAFCDTKLPRTETCVHKVPSTFAHMFTKDPAPHPLQINTIRSRFARFIGKLSFELHNVSNSFGYSKVLELHNAFVKFVSELPFYLQIKLVRNESVVDSRCDSFFPFLKLQRYHLWCDICFYTLSLHCPYLLRMLGKSQKGRYSVSYESCMEAAKLSLDMRRQLLKDKEVPDVPSRSRASIAAFRWYNTIVVSSLLLLLTPPGQDADLLREYMQEYIDWRESQRGQGRDEDVERDIHMVKAFLEHDNSKIAMEAPNDAESDSPDSVESSKRRRVEINAPQVGSTDASPTMMSSTGTLPPLPALTVDSWPSGDMTVNMPQSVAGPQDFNWPLPSNSNIKSNFLDEMVSGLPSHVPPVMQPVGPIQDTENGLAATLNLGGLYRLPQILPTEQTPNGTVMPVWPMNAGTMPNTSQALQMDIPHLESDTQELLNLW